MDTGRPSAFWWVDGQWLYVRFEHIPPDNFDKVLRKFKMALVQPPKWQRDLKAWRLSIGEMERMVIFIHQTFGSNSLYHFTYDSNPIQQALPLTWR
ncbi:MAG: hypothetical protein HY862_16085 [Chloroflexi bacterium]|nr:hypothetical protein [Chloroflexota bacterium]